jgi:hypothetical protein
MPRLEPDKIVNPCITDLCHSGPVVDQQLATTVEPRMGRIIRVVKPGCVPERLMWPLPAVRAD